MISRRDNLLKHPWEQRRYEQHREKVKSAKAAIDRSPPAFYAHILQKAKKQQSEKERTRNVENENIRLLQRLANIMSSKRMSDFWREPRPNFLSREKLFAVRPHTAPMNWMPLEGLKEAVQKSAKGVGRTRCPTCKGQPERQKIIIPEERMPWQPQRLSFNIKFLNKHKFLNCK